MPEASRSGVLDDLPPDLADIGPWSGWARYTVSEVRRQANAQERLAAAIEKLAARMTTQEDKEATDKAETGHEVSRAREDIQSLQKNGVTRRDEVAANKKEWLRAILTVLGSVIASVVAAYITMRMNK